MSEYLKAKGINYHGTLPKIKKKKDPLQPIFEAFTNALESIKLLENETQDKKIIIDIYLNKGLVPDANNKYFDFSKMEITDTGTGFNDVEFQRLENLNDTRKGFQNKGAGRIQFIHAFDTTKVSSVYKDETSLTGFKKRIFTLSKSTVFLNNNAIIRLEDGNEHEAHENNSHTTVIFENVLASREGGDTYFKSITAESLKDSIIKHYLVYFCEHRGNLPEITIKRFIDGVGDTELNIQSGDIPNIDQEQDVTVKYSTWDAKNEIVNTSEQETLNLKAFKINKDDLEKNKLTLVSKGEGAKKITLENLLENDQIDNKRYLFLLSGDYIDDRDSDTRGEIKILNKEEFKEREKSSPFPCENEILLEDIENKVNHTILTMYEEIKIKNKERQQNIEKLKKMFLLNDETLNSLKNKIKIDASDDAILQKVYETDVKIIAKKDAEIKRQIEALDGLNPAQEDYQENLSSKINELVKTIPLQNRTTLTQYVARRKLVLELFSKVINRELEIQQTSNKSIDEKLLHNLIFQQSSDNTEESDLWLVNEDFIYFKGTSESQLGKILLNDNTIIKENLSREEEEYRRKQEGDATQKRPDILLFPKEEKCIIIEFKSLNTNISEHLNQINRYASLINNLSKDAFNFTTYYGYLIGENIDVDDIRDNDSDFISADKLGFILRPYKRIAGKFKKTDGSLYTEIIKYSILLERAKIRNQIFIEKLEDVKTSKVSSGETTKKT